MENPDVFMTFYGLKFLLLKLMTYIHQESFYGVLHSLEEKK